MSDLYHIVAYPEGKRSIVATLPGLNKKQESWVEMAAMRAGVPVGSEAEGIISHARTHAKLLKEYVCVYRNGEEIAVVGEEGAV